MSGRRWRRDGSQLRNRTGTKAHGAVIYQIGPTHFTGIAWRPLWTGRESFRDESQTSLAAAKDAVDGCGAFFLNLTESNMRPLPRKPFPHPCPFTAIRRASPMEER